MTTRIESLSDIGMIAIKGGGLAAKLGWFFGWLIAKICLFGS